MRPQFTLFGMNVVHDDRSSEQADDNSPATYSDYINFLKKQVHSPSAVTPALPEPTCIRIQCQVRARIPTNEGGEMYLYLYKNNQDKKEHMAIVYGDDIRSKSLDCAWRDETIVNRIVRGAYYGTLEQIVSDEQSRTLASDDEAMRKLEEQQKIEKEKWKPNSTAPMVRIHSECFTGETVHSARCDCGEQLDEAMRLMQKEGRGVIVYLRQEGRGIGLLEKLKAYNLQDLGHDTVAANVLLNHPADGRTYGIANAILDDLQLKNVRLLTNNPDKIQQIESYGCVKVIERHPMVPRSWSSSPALDGQAHHEAVTPLRVAALLNNLPSPSSSPPPSSSRRLNEMDKYLKVKVEKMGHMLDVPSNFS